MSKKAKVILGIVIAIPTIFVLLVVVAYLTSSNSGQSTGSHDFDSGSSELGAQSAPASMNFSFSRSEKADIEESVMMDDSAMYDSEPDYADGGGDSSNGNTAPADRLVIKTGSFSVVVDDVNVAVETASQYAKDKGGYVVSSDTSKTGLSPRATVIIRIPAEIFDEGVGEIKALGQVESEYIEGQDVTEEYVDLGARLGNLRATENQYLEIMKKAYEIEDILQVQRYLSDVREDIERIEGGMKYLRESAAMSTITIHMSTDPQVLPILDEGDEWEPWTVIKEATRGLIELAKSLSYLIIWLVVYIPLWLAIWLIVWLIRKFWKRHTVKKMNSGQ
ncbi:DUF4349 domain-containing protein [Patescibacteria group bacterium]|nr:DUF4349 domain-containing protein [Patescibacteria group bacterium]MBU1896031.1 DUF4349 domain-containing protein [Patescibacteria group bacterium]